MDDALKQLVTRLYQEKEVEVQPTYPRILVRLLPREQMSRGGIVLPEHHQNKPVHEGIVLATYTPFWKSLIKSNRENWDRKRAKFFAEIFNDKAKHQLVWIESPVKVGDHVIFPQMEIGITPVWVLDGGKGDYRLVPDDQVLAVLTYERQPVKKWLLETLNLDDSTADRLLEQATILQKDLASRTVSGR